MRAAGNAAGGAKRHIRIGSLVAVAVLLVVAAACDPKPPSPAALDVSVSVSDDAIEFGEQVTFTVTVDNSGTGPASNAWLETTLPPHLTFISATPSLGDCAALPDRIVCGFGQLAVDVAATASIVATSQQTGLATTNFAASDGNTPQGTTSTTIGVYAAPVGVVADTFTRVDAGTLGVAETGQPWSAESGSWNVAGEQAAASTSGYSLAFADAGAAVGMFEVAIPQVADEFWAVLRASDDENYWRFGRVGGESYVLQRVQNNVGTSSGTTIVSAVTPSAGDVIECVLTADSITCYVNDLAVATTSHGFNETATHFGLATFAPSAAPAARFDNFAFRHPQPGPLLTLSMSTSADVVSAGEPVSYTMTVTNDGDGDATTVRLEDILPDHSSFVSATPSQGSCVSAAETFTCQLGALGVGASTTVTLDTTAEEPGLATNAATVHVDNPVSQLHDQATASVSILGDPAGDLADSFTRVDTDSLGTAETGQPWSAISGTWAVANEQAAASSNGYGLVLADGGSSVGTLEVSVPQVSTEFWAVLRASDGQNYWRFGRSNDGSYTLQRVQNDVLANTGATVLADVVPAPGDLLSCTFTAVSVECSVNGTPVVTTEHTFNNTATMFGLATFAAGSPPDVRFDDFVFTHLPPAPLLVLSMTPSLDPIPVDEQLTYSLAIHNSGDAVAAAVRVESTLASELGFVSATPSQGTCTQAAGTVTCDLGPLGTSASVGVTITVDALEPGLATSAAAVYHDLPMPELHDDASSTIAILPEGLGTEVLDSFSRPDQPLLGFADTGHFWTEDIGEWAIEGGHAVHTTSDYGMATFDAGAAFGYYDVVVADPSDEFWIVFHQTDPDNYWRFGTIGGDKYVLHRIEDGQLGTGGFHLTFGEAFPAPGDHIRVRLLSDDSIDLFVNGQHIVGTGSFFNIDATNFGVSSFRGSLATPSVRFDLVQFTPFTADFPEPPHD